MTPGKRLLLVLLALLLGLLALHYRALLADWAGAVRAAPRWWRTTQHANRIDNKIRQRLREAEHNRAPVVFSLQQFCAEEMPGMDKGMHRDEWKNELRLFCKGRLYGVAQPVTLQFTDANSYAVVSAGRDGLLLTADDIVSRPAAHPVTTAYRLLKKNGDGG